MKTNVEHNGQDALSKDCMSVADTEPEVSEPVEPVSPQGAESFTRETSSGAGGDISAWDDQTVLAAIKKECEELRAIDSNYPRQYHRLGTLIIIGRKRFGDDAVKQTLRLENIDNTRAWRAEQIAKLYTFDVAAQAVRAGRRAENRWISQGGKCAGEGTTVERRSSDFIRSARESRGPATRGGHRPESRDRSSAVSPPSG